MPSIAVVVLDTLRYDRFDEYFSWLDGTRFTNAYSTSHWTVPAHASLFTGRYPSEVGTTVKARKLTWEGEVLPEALERNGYTTRNFTTNLQTYIWDGWERGFNERVRGRANSDVDTDPDGVFEWRKFVNEAETADMRTYARGLWECLRSEHPLLRSLRHGYRLKTTQLTSVRAMNSRVRNTAFGDREFLLISLMDTHAPYYPPKAYRPTDRHVMPTLYDGMTGDINDPKLVRRTYDGCARHLSDEYRKLVAELREDFEYVVTLADHGEHLGEDGLWTHAYGLRPELTHVPLVISGDRIPSQTIDDTVSVIDVHRTIADLTGIDVPSRGEHLLDGMSGRDRLVEYHGLAAKRREEFENLGIGEKFEPMDRPLDAIASADGYAYETHDEGLVVSGSWSRNEARRRLDDLVDSIDRTEVTPEDTHVSDTIQQRLEALGYA
jgi:arylsulfatase